MSDLCGISSPPLRKYYAALIHFQRSRWTIATPTLP